MAKYVNKYFVDMQKHLKSVFNAMRLGSSAHYIIGNSTFYDVVVPSDLLYESMMINAGFKDVYSEIVRKRNSKKELFEYRVVGKKY